MNFRIVVATLLFAVSLSYSQVGATMAGTTSSPPLRSYTRTPAAKTRFKTSVGDFALWVDETKWKRDKPDGTGKLDFTHVSGDAWANVTTERIGVPMSVLRDVAVEHARGIDPNAKIILEDRRIVNGRQVLALQVSITAGGIPFIVFGYYHGGSSGSILMMGGTVANLFATYVGELTDLLNGLEISDQELPTSATREAVPDAGVLLVNAKTSLKYNANKWKQKPSDLVGRFFFTHSSGDGFAMVTVLRIPAPFESLPDIVFSNLQKEDPNATMTFKQKRRVNGVEVWYLKMDVEVNRIPLTYCGYYYSGKTGTVEVVTFTGRNLVSEFEHDFMDFLNGLLIAE